MADIRGHADQRFERVSDAFARCFDEYGDVGASVCVTVEGETVVDLWGGQADPSAGKPWQEDTIACVFSATKGIMAIAGHMLVDRGHLNLDAPIAVYWPGFGRNGKESITMRHVLTHTAGVPFLDKTLPPGSWSDWDAVVAACEEQSPEWEPGTTLGYHAATYGWIVGEVIHRISGLTPGQFIAQEIAGPLGADVYLGLPESEFTRVAPWIIPESVTESEAAEEPAERPPFARANDAMYLRNYQEINSRELLAAEIPSLSGCGNARGLATVYRPLALDGAYGGVNLLSNAAVDAVREFQVDGYDAILQLDNARRAVGFKLMAGDMGDGFGENSFGHGGFGGHISCADPDKRLSFGYVMNKSWSGQRGSDPRGNSLIAAAYRCIEAVE